VCVSVCVCVRERRGGGGGVEGHMLGNDPGVSNIYIQRRGIPTRFTNRTRDSFDRPWPKRNSAWCNPLISTGKVILVEDVTFVLTSTDWPFIIAYAVAIHVKAVRCCNSCHRCYTNSITFITTRTLLWPSRTITHAPLIHTFFFQNPCISKLISKRTYLTKEFSARRNSDRLRK
jgi:hypothetical protein